VPQNKRENPFCTKKKLDARFINQSDFLDFFPLVVFLNTSKTGRSALCITRRKKTKNKKRDTHNTTLLR
jgi:hypothetical protein